MKKIFYTCLAALFISTVISAQNMPINPFIRIDSTAYPASAQKRLYTADPSAHVWNIDGVPTLYVYPSHDMEPAYGCDMMDNYHVFSTTDMVHWKDHGVIFGAKDVPWGVGIINGGRKASFMWAPDCVYRNGKYYYYFPHPYGNAPAEGWGNWRIGLAISNYPDKDFVIQDTTILGLAGGNNNLIDPNVFIDVVDGDTTAYFYYGGGQECWGGILNDDMKSIKGSMKRMAGLTYFHEGAWVFKRNGIYYMTYPGNSSNLPNYVAGQDQLMYATSNSPLGPWAFKGSYLRPTGCDTSHGSVVEFNGEWYAFYHNSILSGQGNLRSICVDKLIFDGDSILPVIQTGEDRPIGRKSVPGIVQAENFKNGGEGIGYHDNDDVNTGGSSYRLSTAVDITSSSEGLFVTGIEDGEWLAYDLNVQYENNYLLEVRIASKNDGGKLHVEVNDETVATVDIPNTGAADKWQSVLVRRVTLPAGNQTIKIVMDKGGFNFNYFILALDSLAPIGDTIVIQQGTKYVTLAGDKLRCLKSNRETVTNAEKFVVVDAGNGLVAFKNVGNIQYISQSSSDMSCNSYSAGAANRFSWYFLSNNYKEFAIKSNQTNKFVYIDNNDANRPMKAVSDNIESWETFIVKIVSATPTGISDIQADAKVSLYPNPAGDAVTVVLDNGTDASIQITDLHGRILLQTKTNHQTETSVNISSLPAGLYFVNVVSDEFNVVKKLVVN